MSVEWGRVLPPFFIPSSLMFHSFFIIENMAKSMKNSCTLGELIDRFDGIRIYIYPNDHPPVHFHAYYAEHEAVFSIDSLELIEGTMPSKQRKAIQAWAKGKQAGLRKTFEKLNPTK